MVKGSPKRRVGVRMETRMIRGLTLFFDAEEREAAELVGAACERSVDLMRDLWELEVPGECRVYVVTSWLPFLFHSAPWPWRLWAGATLPLRYARIQKLWDVAGGWAQRYGDRRTIGVKPPRLLREVDTGLREQIFVHRDVEDWVQHNTCHELVHAFTDHLRLPTWLHEGLAMVTVDRFAGRPTVKVETISAFAPQSAASSQHEGYQRITAPPDTLVYLAVHGYWVTRYLAETQPELLRSFLKQQQPHEVLERELAAEMGTSAQELWSTVDGLVVDHFQREGA